MDSLFHFLFPLIAMLAARIRLSHGLVTVLGISAAAVLIDVDHYFGFVPRGTFHNVFVTVLLPVTLLALSFRYGVERHRQISIALLLVMTSHVMLDMFSEGAVYLLYPLSMQQFSLAAFYLMTAEGYYVVTSSSIGLLIYFCIIGMCFFLEDIDLFLVRKHVQFRYALKYAFRKEEKRLNRFI
jgi:membrane-bound metal-dependent hydrolase YbcI (DUF457 family)